MKISGTRFSTIEYEVEDVVTISDGLIGFPDLTRYIIVHSKPNSPFRWLQSLEDPSLAFLIVDPATYIGEYSLQMPESMAASIDLTAETPTVVYATVSIPAGRPDEMTLNLLAPIVINAEKRTACQTVVENPAYTMKHRVFPEANRVGEHAAA